MSFKPHIAFAGTPEFAVPVLEALSSIGTNIAQVLTQPDRPAGRGRKLAPSAIKKLAERKGLPVHQPATLRDDTGLTTHGPRPDLLVVVAYGLLLPEWLLEWPRQGAINIHASLLPRWRGAAPIQRAILEGDRQTGVSIMKMQLALDTGPIFEQRSVEMSSHETAGMLHDRLALLGAELLIETLPGILDGSLRPSPQDEHAVTYAAKISKDEAALDWQQAAESLARRVRAFNPWPICVAALTDGRVLRIHEAEPVRGSIGAAPGSILAAGKDGIDVATSDGTLRLLQVQPPAARVMPVSAYLNAHSLADVSFVR
ncbi:MAG: methionyl-tRNA formyltransferase [Gammaproteobacteria bacterium]